MEKKYLKKIKKEKIINNIMDNSKIKSNKEERKVIYIDWALANVFSDGTIELHKDLQKPEYKELHEAILDHEQQHDYSKGFKHNFLVDFFHTVGSGGLLSFMMSRPKTWIQFLPLYYRRDRGFIYDVNMTISYGIIFIGILALIKIMGGV